MAAVPCHRLNQSLKPAEFDSPRGTGVVHKGPQTRPFKFAVMFSPDTKGHGTSLEYIDGVPVLTVWHVGATGKVGNALFPPRPPPGVAEVLFSSAVPREQDRSVRRFCTGVHGTSRGRWARNTVSDPSLPPPPNPPMT